MTSSTDSALVFGSGNFGSCLADHLADAGRPVLLWSRSKEVVDSLNKTHRNPKYLVDHEFSENITAIGPEFPSKDVLRSMKVVLFAIPTQSLRLVKVQIKYVAFTGVSEECFSRSRIC